MIECSPSTAAEHFRLVRWKCGMVVVVDDAMNVTRWGDSRTDAQIGKSFAVFEEFMKFLEQIQRNFFSYDHP